MSVDTNYRVLRQVLRQYEPKGWAIEFGVYSGASLKIIAEQMPVIGLDSFDGLPEDWRPGFPAGKFGDRGVLAPGRCPNNAMIVSGWFHETLPWLSGKGMMDFGLVHIDCDLYSSTVTALKWIAHRLHPGTIVVFDEYHGYEGHEEHEMRAWHEFCAERAVVAQLIAEGPEEAAFLITGMGRSH